MRRWLGTRLRRLAYRIDGGAGVHLVGANGNRLLRLDRPRARPVYHSGGIVRANGPQVIGPDDFPLRRGPPTPGR